MEEIWKPIVGFEGLYEVSNLGNVKGVKRGRILKPGSCGKYLFVVLCKDGKRKDKLVHRLVADAFCENKFNKPEVNHINEDGFDNRAKNLEWCTRVENIRHGTGIKRHAESQRNDANRSTKVEQYSTCGEKIAEYLSLHDMERKTGFDRSAVSKCANGHPRYSHAYGYLWKFV